MVLFVDETENEEFFIVGGILVESRDYAVEAYLKFKKRIKDFPISNKFKMQVYNEFKSVLLDKNYQRIKLRMVEEINRMDGCVIFSCFIKKEPRFVKEVKEEAYISLLSRIVESIDSDVSVIFDKFNVPSFDNRIVETISNYNNVQAIMPRDSQLEAGLQFADNVCSVLRHYKSTGQRNEWYKILEHKIFEV